MIEICSTSHGVHASISSGSGSRFAGRPALHDVGDVDVLASQPDLPEHPRQQLPGGPDERLPLLVLVEPGRLADEHQVGVGSSRRRTRPGSGVSASRHRGHVAASVAASTSVLRHEAISPPPDSPGRRSPHGRRDGSPRRRPPTPSPGAGPSPARRPRCRTRTPRPRPSAYAPGGRRARSRRAPRTPTAGRSPWSDGRSCRRRRGWCSRSTTWAPARPGRPRFHASAEPSRSTMRPSELTAATAPTTSSPCRSDAVPSPPFMPVPGSGSFPTVAPVPAPTEPSGTGPSAAASHAAYPALGVGTSSRVADDEVEQHRADHDRERARARSRTRRLAPPASA